MFDNPFDQDKLGNMTLLPFDENEIDNMKSYLIPKNIQDAISHEDYFKALEKVVEQVSWNIILLLTLLGLRCEGTH